MQEDITITQLSESLTPDSNGGSANDSDGSSAGAAPTLDVDPQILEALRSKDRIYVLKLGETFEALIMERRYVLSSFLAPIVLPETAGASFGTALCSSLCLIR